MVISDVLSALLTHMISMLQHSAGNKSTICLTIDFTPHTIHVNEVPGCCICLASAIESNVQLMPDECDFLNLFTVKCHCLSPFYDLLHVYSDIQCINISQSSLVQYRMCHICPTLNPY